MGKDAFSQLTGRLGFILAILAIVITVIAMVFVQVDGKLTGVAAIPSLSALYLLVTAGWAVYLSRINAQARVLNAMLNHMTTIGFIVITAGGVIIWTREPGTMPAVLGLLVAWQGPLAVFFAKRYFARIAD